MRNIQRFLWIATASAVLLLSQDTKKAAGRMADKAAMADKMGELLDINSASKAQLEALKGIGPKYAEAIMKGRPYARKDELATKKIVPENVYEAVKGMIIAKKPASKM